MLRPAEGTPRIRSLNASRAAHLGAAQRQGLGVMGMGVGEAELAGGPVCVKRRRCPPATHWVAQGGMAVVGDAHSGLARGRWRAGGVMILGYVPTVIGHNRSARPK